MDNRSLRILSIFFGLTVLMICFSLVKVYEYRKGHPNAISAEDITKQIEAKANMHSVDIPYVVQDDSAGIVFDNSTCSKMDSNLKYRELIRKQDWYTYHAMWKAHLTSKLVAFANTAVSSLGQLYLEDARMFGWANQMAKCFTEKQNKAIKSYLAQAKKNLLVIPTWHDKGYLFPKDVYPTYIPIRDLINSLA